MSNITCWQKFFECLFRRRQKHKSIKNTKKYSTLDNCVSSEYVSPKEREIEEHLKYEEENNVEVVSIPTAEHDMYSGQSTILINECKNSIFFIMRPSASAYIDDCENCHILLGPSNGSVFIRKCKNMKIMCLSHQLRIQHSEDIHISAIVSSRPVLEYCKDIQLISLNCELYDGILWQLEKANINILSNKIYETHDFTPKKNNFKNLLRKSQQLEEFEQIWETVLEKNNLRMKPQKLFFPSFMSLKESTTRITFSEKQIKQKQDLLLLCCKIPLKILLEFLSLENLKEKIKIISVINPEAGFRSLKITHKQNLLKVDTNEGIWYFLLVETSEKALIEELTYNMFLVEDREVIWDLFSQQ